MDKTTKATIETLIRTQVVQALQSSEDAIDTLVRSVCEDEVDEIGRKPDYHSKRKMPWLAWRTEDLMRDAIRAAIVEVIQERREEIKAAVRKAITEDKLVDPYIDLMKERMENGYISISAEYSKD